MTETRPLMLDLFAGTGGASRAFREADWEVVRVELDTQHEAEVHADLTSWVWKGRQPRLVWASPPCTEFSRESMPWSRRGITPSLELVEAAERIIRQVQPEFWVIENVRGASPYLTPRFGSPLTYGPVFLWGNFPPFRARVKPWKEKLSSTKRVQRAAIPYPISRGLLEAIESQLFNAA